MNRYFYIDTEGKQKGTFAPDELKQENVRRETLVWTQGMEQWKRAGEVDELQHLFADTQSAAGTTQAQQQQTVVYGQTAAAPASQVPQAMPKTWLVESILVTILPFILCGNFLSLLGIIGIVYAAQVESFYNRGDYTASAESSRSAGKWTRIAMWIAIGWVLLMAIAIALIIALAGSLTGIGDMLNV
jgi:Interferon-induced transmembrane protein.